MHGVVVVENPSKKLLEERHRLGIDRKDEVWDGVLHMVPPAAAQHNLVQLDLRDALKRIVEPIGLITFTEGGLFLERGLRNFRVPDVLIADPKFMSKRGVERTAELVVEVLSPRDDSYKKLPAYAKCGVPEVWIVEPTSRHVELYVLEKTSYVMQSTKHEAVLTAPRFDIKLSIVDGPKLRLRWGKGSAKI